MFYITRRTYWGKKLYEITISGPLHPDSGFVMDIGTVAEIFTRSKPLEFELIGDVAYKFGKFWVEHPELTGGSRLHSLRCYEQSYISEVEYPSDLLKTGDYKMRETHIFSFCAGHRLHNPELTDERNIAVYGKCNTFHGHNFGLEITVIPSEWDSPQFSITEKIVREQIVDRFDHKTLNDCPEFDGVLPTTENFCKIVWDILSEFFDNLERVRIQETAKNFFDYFGEDADNVRIG